MLEMKKTLAFLPALGVAFLPFLSQVTVSGGNVSLDANELSSISTSLIEGAGSMLNMHIQLVPTIVGVVVVVGIIGLVWALIRMIRRRRR